MMKDIVINGEKISIYICNSFISRLRGLLFRDISYTQGALIYPCNQIHTFMMRFPIDVVYLNQEGKILHIDKNIGINKGLKSVKGSYYILELRANKSTHLELWIGNYTNLEFVGG